ncbi:MAG: glycosyltransferase family 4 protein [Pseudomonadota bacterium]|nr:glycosyltransferase family 4 protein [Pseudomonadota bacterium]
MNVTYVEISDLLWRLRIGLPLDGITRVTLLSLEGLSADPEDRSIKLLAYDAVFKVYKECDFLKAPRKGKASSLGQRPDVASRLMELKPVILWPKVKPKKGDLLFYSGNWWWRMTAFYRIMALKAKFNTRVCVFIHDLIPLVHTEYASPATAEVFQNGMQSVCKTSDFFITNSQASKTDVLRWLSTNTDSTRPVFVTPLPHEFSVSPNAKWSLLRKLPKSFADIFQQGRMAKINVALARGPFVLMVGTIEKRKNVSLVLEAWQRVLIETLDTTPFLVLVGKWGQGAEEIRAKLNGSEALKRGVLVINSASDQLLASLYRRCLFTIYLSLYEGWGLPIGESLWFGKRVLASNISAMPEAGEGMAVYANPNDLEDIINKLLFLIKSPDATYLPPIKMKSLRTRKQFGKSLVEILKSSVSLAE